MAYRRKNRSPGLGVTGRERNHSKLEGKLIRIEQKVDDLQKLQGEMCRLLVSIAKYITKRNEK